MADAQIQVKDANAQSKIFLAKINADGSHTFYHVENETQRSALLAAFAPLATAALQTTANTSLASIVVNTNGLSAGQTTGNTSLATIATNTVGLATATLQGTANTSLANLLTAHNTSNTSLATIVTQTSGLASAAGQTSGNTSLASIVTNTTRATATLDGTLSATGASSSVVVRGDFNISVAVSNGFVGSYQVERSFDGGTTWFPLTAASELMTFSKSQSEIYNEPQASTRYRINLTSVSAGSITFKISQ